jgi:hypothetical protein
MLLARLGEREAAGLLAAAGRFDGAGADVAGPAEVIPAVQAARDKAAAHVAAAIAAAR